MNNVILPNRLKYFCDNDGGLVRTGGSDHGNQIKPRDTKMTQGDHAENIQLEKVASEVVDNDSGASDYRIATYPADYTLELLYKKWKARQIEIPPFQRSFVWKQTQSSKLIESFLVGLPVPAVFLYCEHNSQKYLVIDGQQRLRTIFSFFEGYFDEEHGGQSTVFHLKGLNESSKFNNRQYDDLDDEDKLMLKNAILRAFIVYQQDPDDDTSMYHIFERLNTGRASLQNQEIRSCIYHGGLSDLFDELNGLEVWRKILGRDAPDLRKKDIELILRFFAMRNIDLDKYSKPMKDYLNKYMKRNMDPDESELASLRDIFEKTCNSVVSNLGERPFHVRKGLNVAVFDSVMVAFSDNLERVPCDIAGRYKKLIADEKFVDNTKNSTTDVGAIEQRFREATCQLFRS